jgi:hypothetical protein
VPLPQETRRSARGWELSARTTSVKKQTHNRPLGTDQSVEVEGEVLGPRPHCYEATVAFCFSELESACELNRSTVDRVCCDEAHAGIGNPCGQRGWIEFSAWIFEAWVVG